MLFSIIVPIYNVEKYLRQCIESILFQSYQDFELILVNDGSTDYCEQICNDYACKNTKVKVINKQNGGLVTARKAGAKEARGKYIIPIDGDDWVAPNLLWDIKQIIGMYHPDVTCYGAYQAKSSQNNKIVKTMFREGYYTREDIEKEIFPNLIRSASGQYFPPNEWGKVIERKLYCSCQFSVDDRINLGEDQAMVYPCITKARSLYFLVKPYYYYRIRTNSMTHKKKWGYSWRNLDYLILVLRKELNMDAYSFESQLERFVTHALFNIAESQFRRDESYKVIKKEISYNINKKNNRYCIVNAKFSFLSKESLARVSLLYNYIFLIKSYNYIIEKIRK